jgi:hypothetical protein
MHFEVDFLPGQDWLNITFDEDARQMFVAASHAADQFCLDDDALILVAQDPHYSIDCLIRGAEALNLLATHLPPQLKVDANDMRMALNLVCFAAVYRINAGKSAGRLPDAIMVLAKTLPFPVRKTTLPPAIEVLDQEALSSPIGKVYELIKTATEGAPVYAPLLLIHQLGRALKHLDFTNLQVDGLRKEIQSMTAAFEFTMHNLAMLELLANRHDDTEDEVI